jgi:SAM-dependent methyltransferase
LENTLNPKIIWNKKYKLEKYGSGEFLPSNLLVEHSHLIPKNSLILDIASGEGRHGRYLSNKGLTVLSIDISIVGMNHAKNKSKIGNLEFNGAVIDLHNPFLPENYFDVILNFCFLERNCFDIYKKSLKPNGIIFFETFVKRKDKKEINNHYLEIGELREEFLGFNILHNKVIEGVKGKGNSRRNIEQLIAMKQ